MSKKFLLSILLFLVTSFTAGCTGESSDYNALGNYKEVEMEQVIIEDLSGLKELELENGVGDVEMKTTDSKELSVKVKKSVKVSSDNNAKELLDITDIKTCRSEDKISIKAVHIDDEKKDIWKLKSEKYPSSDLKITYFIEVPSNISSLILKTGVGDVNVVDGRGVLDIETGVGNIYGKNIIPMKTSNFNSGTGNAEIKFADLTESDLINVNCGVGNIKIFIPKDAKCTIEKEEFMKEKTRELINGGGNLIQIKASMGDIEIEIE